MADESTTALAVWVVLSLVLVMELGSCVALVSVMRRSSKAESSVPSWITPEEGGGKARDTTMRAYTLRIAAITAGSRASWFLTLEDGQEERDLVRAVTVGRVGSIWIGGMFAAVSLPTTFSPPLTLLLHDGDALAALPLAAPSADSLAALETGSTVQAWAF